MTDNSLAEQGKKAAAEAAITLVEDGMRLGLGTGSTVFYVVEALARRIRDEGLTVTCIPTSLRTEKQARDLGIPLVDFDTCPELDLTIDGADEVQIGTLALIKGLGAALLREKITAENSRRFVVVADSSKVVLRLGQRAPVPVEVVPFGHQTTKIRLAALGARPVLRLAPGTQDPLLTDGNHFIYDCYDLAPITNPAETDQQIRAITGVVATGLFPSMAEAAYIADGQNVVVLQPS